MSEHLKKAIGSLEAEIEEMQSLLAKLKELDGATEHPAATKKASKAAPKEVKRSAWTPARLAKFRKTMAKRKAAKKTKGPAKTAPAA